MKNFFGTIASQFAPIPPSVFLNTPRPRPAFVDVTAEPRHVQCVLTFIATLQGDMN